MVICGLTKQVIAEGLNKVNSVYPEGERRQGAIAGYQACLNANTTELSDLLKDTRRTLATMELADDYRYYAAFKESVEWVCNVASAAAVLMGKRAFYPSDKNGIRTAGSLLQKEAA